MSQLQQLAPVGGTIQDCASRETLMTNDPLVLAFIEQLSKQLLSPKNKNLPELVALGFWLRPSNIKRLLNSDSEFLRKPLGLVVHFTPANVDTMFVYSWVCSLLMGNNNIIRVASSDSNAKASLLSEFNHLFAQPRFAPIALRNQFLNYDKSSHYSAHLSMLADARVIWGGDDSVTAIRALPTKPRSRDICFADRYSAAVINGDALLENKQILQLAELIWRDTHPHAQQACSSPKVIFWLGSNQNQQALFEQIDKLSIGQERELQTRNNHLVVSQLIQSQGHCAKPLVHNAICVLPVSALQPAYLDWHLGFGLYLLVQVESLEHLSQLIDSKLQTLSYWHVEQAALLKLAETPSITGLDRIVPVGRALEFSPVWDGIDIFNHLSRSIVCL